MTTIAWLAGLLAAHGLLHRAIWLPRPPPAPAKPPPFEPDHSVLMTAVAVPAATAHRISVCLAAGAAIGYLLTAVAVATGAAWAGSATVAAAVLGVTLKGLYFHPWLSIGVAIDLLVLTAALTGWPMTLSG